MAGFLSDNQLTKISGVFETLHTTFSRDITIFKNPKKTVVSTSARFNPIYGRRDTGSTSSISYETVSGVFPARVYHLTSDEAHLSADRQTKIILPAGSSIKSDGTPQGFAGNQFYTFLLTPLEEGE